MNSYKRGPLKGLNFSIDKTWDGNPVEHDPIDVSLTWEFEKIRGRPHKRIVRAKITAPLFDDPEAPDQLPGIVTDLWNYEVIELFFANDNNQYLEVEIGPHGHWLCLLFDGVRKPFNTGEEIELSVENTFVGNIWNASIEIPLAYFPGNVSKINAYGIHGSGENRVYEAWSPVTDGTFTEPDFHRLQFFKRVDRSKFIPSTYGSAPFKDWKYGDMWEGHY